MTQRWAAENLREPETAEYGRLDGPWPTTYQDKWCSAVEAAWGWSCYINARNGFGGYTGFELWYFYWTVEGYVYGVRYG